MAFEASIMGTGSWSIHLARACHEATRTPADAAMGAVLRHLREASGAERAFLLEATPSAGPSRALAVSAARRDAAASFSTHVAARALRAEGPLFLSDVRREPLWADGASVRSLALRSILTASVPAVDDRRLAIVLDSRSALSVDAEQGCSLIRAFAGLVALLHRAAHPHSGHAHRPAATPVGGSPAFVKLQNDILTAARVPLPALVVGESGSGKEMVARALHEGGLGPRRPFVAINCAAIPEALLERELFGATRGAFTGADRDHPGLFRQADGGTVFLDEIGDMPVSLQAKLLRVIQEGSVRAVGGLEERPVDVRLVAATHQDLSTLVAENRFRADLRWRLEVLVLRVPPLRERADDFPLLSERLIERLASRCRLAPARLDPAAAERLLAHSWPGNVRELESVLARALLRARGGVIVASDLDFGSGSTIPEAPETTTAERTLEMRMIEDAMHAARGNMTAAALRIGWSRQTLYRRVHALGLCGDRRGLGATDDQDSSGADGTRSSDSSTFQ